jgi:hypothetical protein
MVSASRIASATGVSRSATVGLALTSEIAIPITDLRLSADSGGPEYPSFLDMQAMNAAMDAGVPAVLAQITDSTGYGYAGFAPGSIVNAANLNPTKFMADRLTEMGMNVSHDYFNFASAYGIGHPVAYGDGAMTLGAGWTTTGFDCVSGNSLIYSPNTTTAPTVLQARLPWRRCSVLYRKFSGFGVMGFDRGGAQQTVNTANATDALGYAEFDFPLGTEPLNIARVSGGSIIPFWVRMWNPDTPRLVFIHALGNGGWTTGRWNGATSPCSPFPALLGIGAHAFDITLGINDFIGSVATATFQANLNALAVQCLSADAPGIALQPDVVLTIPNICASGAAGDFNADYIQAVQDVATANGLRAPLNLRTLSVARNDNTHPSAAGYETIGEYKANTL